MNASHRLTDDDSHLKKSNQTFVFFLNDKLSVVDCGKTPLMTRAKVATRDKRSTVLVLFNGDEALAGGHDAEAVLGVRQSARSIEESIRNAGGNATSAAVVTVHDIIEAVKEHSPRLVVNLIESVNGRGEFEAAACSVLELLGVPFTGSNSLTLAVCQNKPLTKSTLKGMSLNTPSWIVVRQSDVQGDDAGGIVGNLRKNLSFPCIVKPASTDGSHGIDPDSVVLDPVSALERAAFIWDRYGQDALVEEFITGREINVAIVGNGEEARCLPLSEIVFNTPVGVPPIVTYSAKWIDDSEEWGASEVVCPSSLSRRLAARVEKLALEAYASLGCRDYARVDMRISEDGVPYILEVNPNPDLAEDAGFARSARVNGWSYDDLVHHILRASQERTDSTTGVRPVRQERDRASVEENGRVHDRRSRLRAIPRR